MADDISGSAGEKGPLPHQRAVDTLFPSLLIWCPNSMSQDTTNVADVNAVSGIKPELAHRTLEAQRL